MEFKTINTNYNTNTSKGRVLSLLHAIAIANGDINEQTNENFFATTNFFDKFIKRAVREFSFSEALAQLLTESGFVQTATWHTEGKHEGKNMSVKTWLKKRSNTGSYLLAITDKNGTQIPHWAVIKDGVYYDNFDNSNMFVVGAFTNNDEDILDDDNDMVGSA